MENPELITKLGENLYNTVNGKYDMIYKVDLVAIVFEEKTVSCHNIA